jgi:hypothetical protein
MWKVLHHAWSYISTHTEDIGWAAFFGLFFALVLDLLAPDGRIRTGIRLLENKLAQRSAIRLTKRIEELEMQRERYAAYLESDKALYMATFRTAIAMLAAIAMAGGVSALARIIGLFPFVLLAAMFYGLAVVIGIQGARISALDTREKVAK